MSAGSVQRGHGAPTGRMQTIAQLCKSCFQLLFVRLCFTNVIVNPEGDAGALGSRTGSADALHWLPGNASLTGSGHGGH